MDKSIKAARIADQIRDSLAVWTHADLKGYIFSITQVTVSLDLSEATAWVDVIQSEKKNTILRLLQENRSKYQRKFNGQPGKMALIHIDFKLDESNSINERFDTLLQS